MPLSSLERETLFRRLGLLLQGGLPILRALEALQAQSTGLARDVCRQLETRLRRGSSFSQALQRLSPQVGELAWLLAEAGEVSGQLPLVFQQLAVFYQKKRENQKALLQAGLYPALVLCIAGLLGLYFLWSILPLFGDLYRSLNVPLGIGLQCFLALSRLLHRYPWLLLAGLGGLALLARLIWRQRSVFLLRCPGLRSLNRKFWEIRYLRLLSLLLRGGLALDGALPRAQHLLPAGPMRLTAHRLSQQVLAGRPFSQCVREGQTLFSPLTVEFVALGEESGNLSGMLTEAAHILEQDFQSRLKQLRTLLEPALLLVLTLGCGSMLLFLLSPLFELMNGLSFL
ncbi:type II secretion system F family protein [Acidaminococcus fermentans]|uniref:type II secretion system F family protein n=1 Tax=Acidaminococcus fermentans TaxID=905 RepID=UPI0024328A77|nr:type II secretion system F family protein [Acidaminococcus fermentans]MDD6287853.1 type II secretion system F family protein [Acidaminococcus fermentans]